MGEVAPDLERRYAALAIVGGGMAAATDQCPTSCPLPIRFLAGDKNDYHCLAKELRDWFLGCKQEVEWELLPGANHPLEWKALTSPGKADAIIDWLAARPLACKAIAAATTADVGPEDADGDDVGT